MLDVATLSAALLSQPATDDTAEALSTAKPVLVDLQPGLWFTRVRGLTSTGTTEFELDTQLGLDEHLGAFRGCLTITREPWTAKLMGTSFHANGHAQTSGGTWADQPVEAGDPTAFDVSWLQFELQWDQRNPMGDGSRRTTEPMELLFGPHVAVSYLNLEQRLTSSGGTVERDGAWWSLMVGGQFTMQADMHRFADWMHQLRVEIAAAGGASMDGGSTWSIRATTTVMFTPTIGLSAGYRLVEFNELTRDDWTVSPRFPGFYLGLNIAF